MMIVIDRLEQGRRQGRRQGQSHQHRQQHGGDDGDGELPVDDPGGAPEEGHGHEDRREHQGDADDGAGDLVHGLARRLPGREPILVHDPRDVFHHHDGIVHQQANGQHHGEERQGIDAIAKGRQNAKGAEQHHGHGDGRDQGGAEVLQEEVHDQEHQDHRLDESGHHLTDRDAHEGRGVVGVNGLHARGKIGGQVSHLAFHRVGGLQGIGPGGQADRHAGSGLAQVAAIAAIALAAQGDAGQVAEVNRGPILLGAQADGAELLRRRQPALDIHGRGELLALVRGTGPELTR